MKIATWNIERLQKRKNKEIIQAIKQINADILILTEASDLIHLSDDYPFNSKTILLHDSNNNYRTDERRVIIYSKYPITQTIKTYDERTSCCAEIETTFGNLVVYGTIIGIYGNRRKCFLEDLENQLIDINKISQSTNFCLAGDLNISFSDNYYFTKIGREKLNDVFSKNNLINKTKDIPQNIDHIIISSNFIENTNCTTTTWNHDKLLSDHSVIRTVINFTYPFEQEVGSVGEQPASDRMDVYTIDGKQQCLPFLFTSVNYMAKQTHYGLFLKCRYHLIKFFFASNLKPR